VESAAREPPYRKVDSLDLRRESGLSKGRTVRLPLLEVIPSELEVVFDRKALQDEGALLSYREQAEYILAGTLRSTVF